MAYTFQKLFSPQQLPTAVGVIFTVPAAPATGVLKNGRVRVSNTSAASVAVTLYADVAATASGPINCFVNAQSIAPNDWLDIDIPTMAAGDTLRGFAGAATSLSIHEIGGVITT